MTPPLAIQSARLLTSAEAPIIDTGVVHVREGRITYAGPLATAPAWSGDHTDLGDVTVLPGLIDCHVHLCMDPAGGGTTTDSDLDHEQLQARMIANAARLLDAGVTTGRDLGAPATLGTRVRDLLASTDAHATPRLLAANTPVTVPGGHAHAMGGEAAGVEGVRSKVRELAEQGVDVIKVMTTGGFMTAGTHPWQARYSLEELSALVDEAHRHGLPVTTHALGTEGIHRATLAGVDTIEHCGWVTEAGTEFDPRIAQMIVDQGVSISPTMNSACSAETYFCPWDERKHVIGNLRQMIDIGATIVAGTDAGIGYVHFESFAECLRIFVEAGMTPREALASATTTAAQVCGIGDTTGRLEPGHAADLIAVSGDPTTDITTLSHPRYVLAQGRPHTPRSATPSPPTEEGMAAVRAALAGGAGRSAER